MGYWPSVRSRWLDIGKVFFFCLFMDRDGGEVHKLEKRTGGLACPLGKPITAQVSVHLARSRSYPYNKSSYYMASSASGQDEPNRGLWLATRAGKMEPPCPLGTTRCIPKAKFLQKPYNKSFIDQVCSVKMAGYWPRSFFASLWTETKSRFINTWSYFSNHINNSWGN